MTSILISAAGVHELLSASSRTVRVLDVRWTLAQPDGRDAFAAGHIPGAVYVDLDHELAAPPDPARGRHPLPDPVDFERSARRWGIRDGDTVVVYDDAGNTSAARAWWLLRDAGVADVRVLDGALKAWREAGYEVEDGDTLPEPGDVTLTSGQSRVLTIDEAARFPEIGVLLDARAAERFRGDVEPIDPRAGHIPGARSMPTVENLDEHGRFLAVGLLRDRFAAAGVRTDDPVAAYCGSGVTASHTVLALAVAGFDAALFPGSWSQWSNDPARPVAVGVQR